MAGDISFEGLRREIQETTLSTFWADLKAGMQLALLTIPQAMAYALVAGLPISCGLFAAIFSAIMGCLAGSSRFLVMGPVNAISILVQAGTSQILFTYFRDVTGPEREQLAIQITTQLALIAGIFQASAGFFKFGRLAHFVSHSVVIAYMAGTSLTIVLTQLYVLLGIPRGNGISSLFERGLNLFLNLDQIAWPAGIVGITSLVGLSFFKRWRPQIPGAAVIFGVVGIAVYALQMSPYASLIEQIDLVGDTAERFEVIPYFAWPSFEMGLMNQMLPIAFAIAFLGMIETACVTKAMAAASGQAISLNQEIMALGMGNLTSSFTGALPISTSPSRSFLNMSSGSKTRLSSISNALFVALIVSVLGFFINLIPLSALSALLIFTAISLVNIKQLLLCLKATASDALVFWLTFFACWFFNIDTAFYIGVILSVALYLKKAAEPHLMEFVIEENGSLRRLSAAQKVQEQTIRVIKVEGELFFGAANLFQNTLKTLTEDDATTRVLILQLKNARDMDATACLALQQMHGYLSTSGRHLIACGLTQDVWDVLSNAGMIEELGKENLFLFEEKQPTLCMRKALERAKELALSCPIPSPHLNPEFTISIVNA